MIIYQGGQVFSLANRMNNRVGFVATMPSTSASIFINNTQLADTGTYQCLVNNLPDRGGRNIGVIGLTVLGTFPLPKKVVPSIFFQKWCCLHFGIQSLIEMILTGESFVSE